MKSCLSFVNWQRGSLPERTNFYRHTDSLIVELKYIWKLRNSHIKPEVNPVIQLYCEGLIYHISSYTKGLYPDKWVEMDSHGL